MRNLKQTAFAVLLLPLMACGGGAQQQAPAETPVQDSLKNQVVETIMTPSKDANDCRMRNQCSKCNE